MAESWQVFMTRISEDSALVYVDVQYDGAIPDDKPYMLRLALGLQQADAHGFPSEAEQEVLNALEDRLMETVPAEMNAVYVGRLTMKGTRQFYFYGSEPRAFQGVVEAVMQEQPSYRFNCKAAEDPKWEGYRQVLLPTKYDWQTIKNQQVVRALMDAGDNLQAKRPVQHFAYFPSEDARDQYVKRVTDGGFEIDSLPVAEAGEETERPYGVIATLTHPIVGGTLLDDLTCGLLDAAEEVGGEYDGWETPVIK